MVGPQPYPASIIIIKNNNNNNNNIVDDKERIAYIIDISVPGENNINKKMAEKRSKYYDLKREISRIWSLTQVDVVPVVVGALGGLVGEAPQCLRSSGLCREETWLLCNRRLSKVRLKY